MNRDASSSASAWAPWEFAVARRRWLIALFLTGLLLPGIFLKDFWIYNEGRRALIALEMVRGEGWLVPHLMGVPIVTKPPLFYWLEAIAFYLTGGPSDWAARLPSVAAAVLCVLMLIDMLEQMLDRESALAAGIMLAVTPVFVGMAQSAEPEMLFVSCGVAAMACFARIAFGGATRRAVYLFWFFLMLSFMAKGPVMPIVVVLAIVLYLLAARDSATARMLVSWRAMVLAFLPMALYFAMLQTKINAFQLLTSEAASHMEEGAPHSKEIAYYLKSVYKLCFPWVFMILVALFFGVWSAWAKTKNFSSIGAAVRFYLMRDKAARLPFVIWFFIACVVLSCIPSKRYYYGLILAPPVAALSGLVFHDFKARFGAAANSWNRSRAILRILTGGFAIGLLAAGLLMKAPARWQELDGKSILDDNILLLLFGSWLLAFAIFRQPAMSARNGFRLCFWIFAGCMAGLIAAYNYVLTPGMNDAYSLKRSAQDVAAMLGGNEHALFSLQDTHTVCFYIGRPDIPVFKNANQVEHFLARHPGARGLVYEKNVEPLENNRSIKLTRVRDCVVNKDYWLYVIEDGGSIAPPTP